MSTFFVKSSKGWLSGYGSYVGAPFSLAACSWVSEQEEAAGYRPGPARWLSQELVGAKVEGVEVIEQKRVSRNCVKNTTVLSW